MFTIEVKKRGKDEEFEPKDLELFHKECYGGKVSIRVEQTDGLSSVLPLNWEVRITCQRCGSCVELPDSLKQKIRSSIIKTAIDGEERELSNDIRVIQKS